jgi:hypothetical protein
LLDLLPSQHSAAFGTREVVLISHGFRVVARSSIV